MGNMGKSKFYSTHVSLHCIDGCNITGVIAVCWIKQALCQRSQADYGCPAGFGGAG